MATAFSLISLLVCIHRTSAASTTQPNITHLYTPSLSTHSTSLQPSLSSSSTSSLSSSSTSPLLATLLNSTTGVSRSTMILAMSSLTTISSSQSPTNWSSLAIIASSSTHSLSPEMDTTFYTESPNSSTTFETSDMYIVTTEEIWLSTLDPVIAATSAPLSSTSYHSNASLPPFPTHPPPALPSPVPSSSPDAMSGGSERTTPSTMSTPSTTTHSLNGSTPISATQSTSHKPDVTSSFFNSNVTSVVESHTILMTASADRNVSVSSIELVVKSTQMLFSSDMNMTATPWIYETPVPTTVSLASSSIPWNASRSEVLSAMPSTPMSSTSTVAAVSPSALPEIIPTNATLATDTTLPIEYVQVRCTLVLGGDCALVLAKEDTFKTNFTKSISSLISLDPLRITVNAVKCGSVVVDFTLEDTIEGDFAEDLYGFMDTGKISVPFDDQNMIAEDIVFHNGPYADTTPTLSDGVGPLTSDTPPVSDGDGGGMSFEQQQRLIYILIGVVVGFAILLAIVLVVHHAMRKTCSKSTQSFDLQDEPCIKLTDFNMAHTCIPRPRSIYSSIGADGRFFRYDNQEDIGNPPGSPTSFMYADSQDIKEHYHEVIDPDVHDPLTSSMQNQQGFGRSGLPEWNLPLIDGAPPVSPDLLTTIDSHHSSQPSTSSDTFRPPSTSSSTLNNAPVFSPPAPPPPPPPPLPTPVIQSGTLRSRTSCDASSEMTDSSGDTNTLTRGSSDIGTSMMGIDNPLMTPEEDYDIPGPSTSGRMSKYVVR